MVEGFALGQSSVQIDPHKHRDYKDNGKLTMTQDNAMLHGNAHVASQKRKNKNNILMVPGL